MYDVPKQSELPEETGMKKFLYIISGYDLFKAPQAWMPIGVLGLLGLALAWHGPALAQNAPAKYANMAAVEQYLERSQSAEIALARSAAPKGISGDATV